MAKSQLNKLPASHVMYLNKLYLRTLRAENHVLADFLPYTAQIKWIVAEMKKKYPKSPWTEKLAARTLIRLRKADLLEKTERPGKEDIPVFPEDNDQNDDGSPCVEFQEEGEV